MLEMGLYGSEGGVALTTPSLPLSIAWIRLSSRNAQDRLLRSYADIQCLSHALAA
jgi:hypothetical protein